MRTLQEKYNGINEGNFTKEQFLRDARLQLPTLVTQYNGYDDAVQILKNRGIIQEVKIEEARLTNKSLTDYRYKPTNDMDKYPYEQILRGLRVELEGLNVLGTPTPEEYTKALGKVLKNLEKDSIFYTNQVAGEKAKAKRTDVMVDATPKNEVDKENRLQKAALKEAIKGVIKNILSEDLDPDLYDQDEEREERRSEYGQNEFGDGEDIYEMQGPKEDSEYKSELDDYLRDNQIYGYTNRIHDIMTGPDEDEAYRELAEYLDGEGIYGYTRAIERIYVDYPYDQHWMNQPDEDDLMEGNSEEDIRRIKKYAERYEVANSDFERIYRQMQTAIKDPKTTDPTRLTFKHELGLMDKGKAFALQSLSNQDKYQASIEGMDESISLKDIL